MQSPRRQQQPLSGRALVLGAAVASGVAIGLSYLPLRWVERAIMLIAVGTVTAVVTVVAARLLRWICRPNDRAAQRSKSSPSADRSETM